MANEFVAEPDLQFTKDLIAAGAGDLKKCYQCATCSVACPISPDNNPYPRKEMIWAQWGLKKKLLNDPDVWLCHQCNDCSTQCPRGAYPGDVLKAIRKMNIQENSWPSVLGNLVGQPSLFVLTMGIPVVVVLLLLVMNNGFTFPKPVHYGQFIDYIHIQIVYTLALIFAVVSLVLSLRSFWGNSGIQQPVGSRHSAERFCAQSNRGAQGYSSALDIQRLRGEQHTVRVPSSRFLGHDRAICDDGHRRVQHRHPPYSASVPRRPRNHSHQNPGQRQCRGFCAGPGNHAGSAAHCAGTDRQQLLL